MKVPVDIRNQLAHGFREAICAKMDITPLVHQRAWWLASEGYELVPGVVPPDAPGTTVQLPDRSIERWGIVPREGGHARFLSDLGAFKVGKSFGSALWMAGFAAVPDARISLVGMEYDICGPEFDYIVEFLLSDRGMGLKADSLQNRPRDGKMWLDLPNGCRFEAKSWERRESLKGKEIDVYAFCEAYQFPGIECFTSHSQNLRARQGFAVFATTPDRPWIKLLHELGHSADREWACTCGVSADVNSHTYDAKARTRDEGLMTREKFQIHYHGQLGDFVGHVYNYQRGAVEFNAITHPFLYPQGPTGPLVLPRGWEVVAGADTGTFYTALAVAFAPSGDAFVLAEWPNYRYVAGEPERDESIAIPQWAHGVARSLTQLGARTNLFADPNSQFRGELRNYGLNLLPNATSFETRTEIAREYFQHGKVWLHPSLSILPFELENAAWPDEATAAGKFARVKDRDHTLDCLEHILSRRPRGRVPSGPPRERRWIDSFVRASRTSRPAKGNLHLGFD